MIRFFTPSDGRLLAVLAILGLKERHALAFTPEGHYRAFGRFPDPFVYVAMTASGEQLTLSADEFYAKYGWKNDPAKVRLSPADAPMVTTETSVAKSPPSRTATTEGGEPICPTAAVARPAKIPGVKSWTIETRNSADEVRAVAYSPDGKWIATAGDDSVIRLRSAETGELVRALVGHTGSVHHLAWSPDSQTLASSSGAWSDPTFRLWDAASGRLLKAYPGMPGYQPLAWSPDGKILAVAQRDQGVDLHHFPPKDLLLEPSRLQDLEVKDGVQLAWSPNGQMLAVATWRAAFTLWTRPRGDGAPLGSSTANTTVWPGPATAIPSPPHMAIRSTHGA